MRILHLFSDKKLTGPADPVLGLCGELKRQGADVLLACCSSGRTGSVAVVERARELGLDPIVSFRLRKHFDLRDNLRDLRMLPDFLREQRVDIVHTHLHNDHLVGAQAARNTGNGILVVRSSYRGEGPRRSVRNRYVFGKLTDGVIVPSEVARRTMEKRFAFPSERTWLVSGAINNDRFSPANVTRDMRPEFGLKADDFVVGIIARIQTHRRFEILLRAMKIVSRYDPRIKLLIIGRGTKMMEVAVEPVKQMGLTKCVTFAGYRVGQEYVDTLACLDVKVFLVPGTDGTCRAVREAMAMGKPVITARRGMLPEIVDHGVNGIVVEDSPDALAGAIRHLADDRDLLLSMSNEAYRKAREKYRPDVQARRVREIYEHLRGMGTLAARSR